MSFADPIRRAALIGGLRALADYLESNPDVPAPKYTEVYTFPPDGECAVMRAEIDAAAALLGIRAWWTPGGHYMARRMFGPVEYQVVAICKQHDHSRGAAR
jgi:hypothetical protein